MVNLLLSIRLISTSSGDKVNEGINNVYKWVAFSKSSGFCGSKSDVPSTTLNEPSLSKKILSILFK